MDLGRIRGGRMDAAFQGSWTRGGATNRLTIAVVVASGVIRLVIAALTPLFPDETYYWEWSRRLAFGYYDHPPMIAWLIRAGTLVAGHTAIGVRLGAVLAGVIATWFACLSARRLGDDRAALMTAIVFASMPLSAAGFVLATPDAPLFAACSATIYAVIRALEHGVRSAESLRWWCAAGVALGLAFVSKYTSALLPFGLVVAFLARRDLRARFREPGPYVATAIALAVMLPVILWNARHEWASLAFQLQHGLAAVGGSPVGRELELVGGQAGLVTPVLFVMLVIAVAAARRGAMAARDALAVAATVIFAFFVYSATKRRVEANWPALAYVPAVLLLVTHPASLAWKRWMRAGVALAAIATFVTYVNAFTPILPVSARRDPAARAAGWSDLGRAVDSALAARPVDTSRTFVAANRYQDASELAFHVSGNPEVFSLNLGARSNQYGYWPGFAARARARDALIMVVEDDEYEPAAITALRPHFASVKRDAVVALARDGDVIRRVRIWVLSGWRGTMPSPLLR